MYMCVGKLWRMYAWEHYLSNIHIKNCILIQNKNRPKFMNSFRKADSLQNAQQLHSPFRNHNRLKRFKCSTTWNAKATSRFVTVITRLWVKGANFLENRLRVYI